MLVEAGCLAFYSFANEGFFVKNLLIFVILGWSFLVAVASLIFLKGWREKKVKVLKDREREVNAIVEL